MAESTMGEVAGQLLDQSRAGKVEWTKVEEQDDTYKVKYSEVSLAISMWSPLHQVKWERIQDIARGFNVGGIIYKLDLVNTAGEVVESLSAVPGHGLYGSLREIFDLASGKARRATDTIEAALRHLKPQ